MLGMFQGAIEFDDDLEWDTRNVKDLRHMFASASSFDGDLSSFELSPEVEMDYMFQSKLTIAEAWHGVMTGPNLAALQTPQALVAKASRIGKSTMWRTCRRFSRIRLAWRTLT